MDAKLKLAVLDKMISQLTEIRDNFASTVEAPAQDELKAKRQFTLNQMNMQKETLEWAREAAAIQSAYAGGRSETLIAVEFGYKQCERGYNLEAAITTAKDLL